MRDTILLNTKIVELSSKSTNTKEIIMYVHTIDEENHNGLTFTLDSTTKYMHTLIDKPVVVKMNVTESDFKGHEPVYDANGKIVKLDTIPVGTITDVWIEDNEVDGETKKALMCKATIWSYKFPTVVEIMQDLFTEGNLDTSVEVAIFSYTEDSTSDHRKTVDIEYLSNCLLGSTILPADSNAGVVEMFYKEVAEALNLNKSGQNPDLDINAQNGGVLMISNEEIKDQLRALLNPNDNEQGGWKLDYYTWDMFTYENHCVVRSAEDGKYYKFNFEVQNETTIVLQGEPVQQMFQFVDVPEGEVAEVGGLFDKFKELEVKVNELNTSMEEKATELNTLLAEKSQLETKVEELSQVKTDEEVKDDAIVKLNEQINKLQDEISAIQPLVEDYNRIQEENRQAELAQKQATLKQFALNSKVIEEAEFESNEELKTAITEVNEAFVKSLIADRVVAKTTVVETNSKNDGDVVIATAEPKDLIPETVLGKYGISN